MIDYCYLFQKILKENIQTLHNLVSKIGKIEELDIQSDLSYEDNHENNCYFVMVGNCDDILNNYEEIVIKNDEKRNIPDLLMFKTLYKGKYKSVYTINVNLMKPTENSPLQSYISNEILEIMYKYNNYYISDIPYCKNALKLLHNTLDQINTVDNIMFLDTETTGLSSKNNKIIQIGFKIYNNFRHLLATLVLYRYPDGFYITKSSYNVHNISEKILYEKGIHITTILNILLTYINFVDTIVTHNTDFDIKFILYEALRINNTKLINKINEKNIICTSKNGARAMCHVNKNNHNASSIPLTLLYKKLFNKEYDHQHDALSDAEICKDCFYGLLDNNFELKIQKYIENDDNFICKNTNKIFDNTKFINTFENDTFENDTFENDIYNDYTKKSIISKCIPIDENLDIIESLLNDLIGKTIETYIHCNNMVIKIETSNSIGDMAETLIYHTFKDKISSFKKGPSQLSPDFYTSLENFEYELKVFGPNGANFDISNFTSYINQLIKNGGVYRKLFKTKYIILEYTFKNGCATIINVHVRNIWNLVKFDGKYPITLQCKKGMWYNIRPCAPSSWYDEKKTAEIFINKLLESIEKCPNSIDNRDEKCDIITDQYNSLCIEYEDVH